VFGYVENEYIKLVTTVEKRHSEENFQFPFRLNSSKVI